MLRDLSLCHHPHLIKLLATYTFHNKYHLLFPWADYDLRKFWRFTSIPQWNRETAYWAVEQMKGLISAVNAIHHFNPSHPLESDTPNPEVTRRRPFVTRLRVKEAEKRFGRHGDLKPENILCVKNGSSGLWTLKITDLGLGRFHGLESRSKSKPANVSPTYASPEIQLDQEVARSYDIWSIGCVFLEFVTWLLEGWKGVESFSYARLADAGDGIHDDTFHTIMESTERRRYAVLRPQVGNWIERLKQNRRCSGMIRDLLSLVKDEMLQSDPRDRRSAENLDSRLHIILSRGDQDANYLVG